MLHVRRFPFVTRLTLPAGTVDLARDIPAEEIELIATKAMLASRDGLSSRAHQPAAGGRARRSRRPGLFRGGRPVPEHDPGRPAGVHGRGAAHPFCGTSFLYRTFPFWIATFLDRTLILIVPLLVVLVPLINFFPQIGRCACGRACIAGTASWARGGVASPGVLPPLERWLATLDRIERAAAGVRIPASFASEAYTLREHVGFVRRAVIAKGAGAGSAAPEG